MVIVHLLDKQRRLISAEKGETVDQLCQRFCNQYNFPAHQFQFYCVSADEPLPLNLIVNEIKEIRLKRKLESDNKCVDEISIQLRTEQKIAPPRPSPRKSIQNEKTMKRSAPMPPQAMSAVAISLPDPPLNPVPRKSLEPPPINEDSDQSKTYKSISVSCDSDTEDVKPQLTFTKSVLQKETNNSDTEDLDPQSKFRSSVEDNEKRGAQLLSVCQKEASNSDTDYVESQLVVTNLGQRGTDRCAQPSSVFQKEASNLNTETLEPPSNITNSMQCNIDPCDQSLSVYPKESCNSDTEDVEPHLNFQNLVLRGTDREAQPLSVCQKESCNSDTEDLEPQSTNQGAQSILIFTGESCNSSGTSNEGTPSIDGIRINNYPQMDESDSNVSDGILHSEDQDEHVQLIKAEEIGIQISPTTELDNSPSYNEEPLVQIRISHRREDCVSINMCSIITIEDEQLAHVSVDKKCDVSAPFSNITVEGNRGSLTKTVTSSSPTVPVVIRTVSSTSQGQPNTINECGFEKTARPDYQPLRPKSLFFSPGGI